MLGRLEMLKSMCVHRVFATPDMTAGETHPELVPGLTEREAFFAACCPWLYLLNLARVFARLRQYRHKVSKLERIG